jgi:hypothetical protein
MAGGSSVISAAAAAGAIMQATKRPLTTWFLAFYLIGQAKTGISSLELSRHLGVNYDTAWLLHNKICVRWLIGKSPTCCGERSRSMMPTSVENSRGAWLVGDQKTRSPSLLPSP